MENSSTTKVDQFLGAHDSDDDIELELAESDFDHRDQDQFNKRTLKLYQKSQKRRTPNGHITHPSQLECLTLKSKKVLLKCE